MSIEYIIHIDKNNDDVFYLILRSIKRNFPAAQYSEDNSLWIPSIDPKWIDFSIEKSGNDIFIMSNLNGESLGKIFSTIESIFKKNEIKYSIEEI
jgi:hypothetical protein